MPIQDLKIETNNSSIRQWKNNYNELVNETIRLEIEKLDLDGSDIMTGPLRVGDGTVTFNNDLLQNLASGSINAHQILSNNTSDLEFQLNTSDFELVLDSTSLFNLNSSNLNVSVPITMPAGSNIDGHLIVDETRLVLPISDPGGPLDGLMSYQDKDKLDDIEAGAQVNVSHDLDRILSTTNATITITNGTNTTIPLVDKDGNATFPNGTAGLMSPDDKTALDTLVSTTDVVTNLGTTVIAGLRTITSSTGSNVEIPNATATDPGFMSSAQVTSLNNKFDTAGIALSKTGTTIDAMLASKVQAEAGTDNTVLMTPLRVEEHGAKNLVPLERELTAGTGLTGGGDLSVNRSFNVDYGTTAGTACEGNDVRLSDARDWTADIVSQTEAEAGGSQTARKWTAQRVHQAAVEAIKDTDGPGSGYDADTVDGLHAGAFALSAHTHATLSPGTGLSGTSYDGSTSHEWAVIYGTTAGTACEGNDVRLSDARDWDEVIVSQTEAKAGESSSARKWTAVRVHEAAVEAIKDTDGPGSGYDADTVDGVHASSFLRSDSNNSVVPVSNINFVNQEATNLNNDGDLIWDLSDGLYNQRSSNAYQIWDSGNDGSGSGLDADTVDGQHAGAFASYTSSITDVEWVSYDAPQGSFESDSLGIILWRSFDAGLTADIPLADSNTVGVVSTQNQTFGGAKTALDFVASSDERLKTNINILPKEYALDIVNTLRPSTFNWKKDDRFDYGLIGQEVESVIPEMVHTDENGMKAVNYAKLTTFLIGAVKNLTKRLQALESQSS